LKLECIAVAVDDSEAARHAYRIGLDLAARAHARLAVLQAVASRRVPVGAYHDGSAAERERLEAWVASASSASDVPVTVDLRFGDPSIEICRFAEAQGADLVVMGRKPRTQAERFLTGDTADSVMRRSSVPTLLAASGDSIHRVLVAVDRSLRAARVCQAADDFTRLIGASLRAVTAEPVTEEAQAGTARFTPVGGTARLRARLGEALTIRRGPVFEQVLAEIRDTESDLLAIGVHRGGPPGMLELGSIGRNLAHAAPCAVLTIPL
jgi:nucleotide-binding universal stress UspA family protein